MTHSPSDDRLRFVIVNHDEFTRTGLKRHLNAAGCHVIGEGRDLRSGLRLIRGLQPDFVVMGLGHDPERSLNAVRIVREEQPHTGIILLSQDRSPDLILEAIRAGAQEFLPIPVDYPALDEAIARLRGQQAQRSAPPAPRGRILSVCPVKGGIGGTSIATNVALSLAARPKRVCLVDFGLPGGDAAFLLDVDAERYFAPSVADGRIDADRVRERVAHHRSGLQVLTMFEFPEQWRHLRDDRVAELFGVLNQMYDYVVVDLGSGVGGRAGEVLELCDELLIVTGLEAAAIRSGAGYLRWLQRLDIPKDRVRVVLNRHQDEGVTTEDVEHALDAEVYWALPNDYRPMRHAMDARDPILLDSPGSRLARSYRSLAASICETHEETDLLTTVDVRPKDATESTG